jgi:hypothetical protein
MNQLEILKFASVLESGMEKQALSMLGRLSRAGARMAGGGTTGGINLARAGVSAVGEGARTAARNTGDLVNAGQEMWNKAAPAVGRFMTKERHLPTANLGQAWNEGRRGMEPGSLSRMGNTTVPQGPYVPPNMTMGNATGRQGPQMLNPRLPNAPKMQMAPNNGLPPLTSQAANVRPTGHTVPAGAGGASAAPAGLPLGHEYDAAPGSMPSGVLTPQNTGYMDQAKQFWQARGLPQRAGLGYAGVTAATAPSNYINNQKVDWQRQHPIMSWAGQTFGGMPKYQDHTYAMPSFLQR